MIRSFIYLDEYKLYSLLSQLRGGLVGERVSVQCERTAESESQRGPIASGRLLGDVNESENRKEVRSISHDYAYTDLEEALQSTNRLTVISDAIPAADHVPASGIVKVTGTSVFNDVQATAEFIRDMNKFSEALGTMMAFAKHRDEATALFQKIAMATNKHEKERLKAQRAQLVCSEGMTQFPPDILEDFAYLMQQGLGDQLEFRVRPANRGVVFTSLLNREHLREEEQAIVRKYSRRPQTPFTVLGVVTQRGPSATEPEAELETPDNPREFMLMMAMKLLVLEEAFSGAQPGEIVLDPIAVYREL